MNPRSSGSGPAIGVWKNGCAPSGSIVTAPRLANNVAIWFCACDAMRAANGVEPMIRVRNVRATVRA